MRVFVLGAGFSIPAGMPSTFDLTDIVLNEQHLTDLVSKDFLKWLTTFKKKLGWLNRYSLGGINLEEFFHFAIFEIEGEKSTTTFSSGGSK